MDELNTTTKILFWCGFVIVALIPFLMILRAAKKQRERTIQEEKNSHIAPHLGAEAPRASTSDTKEKEKQALREQLSGLSMEELTVISKSYFLPPLTQEVARELVITRGQEEKANGISETQQKQSADKKIPEIRLTNRGGYSYDDAVKVNGVREEYSIVEATDCDECKRAGYEKNQGSDPYSRFAQGAFFDVIHCECKFCHHRRDFVFDITGLPKFQMMIALAQSSSEDPDVLQQVGMLYNEQYRKGLSTELKLATPPLDPTEESTSSDHYLPMIFALGHLRVRFNRSGDIAREACLVQGTRDIPAASDEQIDAWLKSKQHLGGTIPQDIELQLLTAACSGWPEEASIAFAGISSFGAGDLKRAAACAHHALQQNPQCTMARQLVKLLTAKGDPRKPFGVEVKDAPDVVQMLSE